MHLTNTDGRQVDALSGNCAPYNRLSGRLMALSGNCAPYNSKEG